jgi:hypothetical protein
MGGQRADPNSDCLPDMEHHDECSNSFLGAQEDDQQIAPPRTLLTRPVLLTTASYSAFAFLEICVSIFLPLVYTTPIQHGGLGLDPPLMGVTIAVYGIMKGILQLTIFNRILGFLGVRRTFITLISCFIPSFLLFPIAGIRTQYAGRDTILWVLVLVQLLFSIGITMAYGTQRPPSLLQGEDFLNVCFRLCLHIYIFCGPKGYARCDKRPHANCRVHTARAWPRNHSATLLVLIREEHYGWLWRVLRADVVHIRGPMACFAPPARRMEGAGVVLFDF